MDCMNLECWAHDTKATFHCGDLLVNPSRCKSFLITKKADGSKVPCSDRVMPARVEERMEAYHILFADGGMYLQRKHTTRATESPLSFLEIVVTKLCETILEKQA